MEPTYFYKDHTYSLKLSILGPISAGKSSILSRYSNNLFSPNLLTTINIDILTKLLQIDNELIKIEIWDSPGDERYTPTTKACYRRAHGFFVVFDLNDSLTFEKCQSWVDEIKVQGHPESVIVLRGNKKDTAIKRVICKDSAEQFARTNGLFCYIETSAVTGENIDKAFEEIIKEIVMRVKNGKLIFPNLDGSLRLKEKEKEKAKTMGGCCLKTEK